MPTARSTVLYDVNDFQVNPLLTDLTTAPTFGTPTVDIPGVASVSMQPNIISNELKGDAKIIAKKGNIDRYSFSATYGRLSLDALVVFIGGTITDVTTPMSVSWKMGGINSLPYFKAQFQILQGEVADTHFTGYKSQVTGGTLFDQSSDSFGQPKIDFECIPCISDPSIFIDISLYSAVTPIV